MSKKKVYVFDTETTTNHALIWNIAVATSEGKVKMNLVNTPLMEMSVKEQFRFYPDNRKLRLSAGAEQTTPLEMLKEIKKWINNVNKYQNEVWAYNVSFDINAIATTAQFYGFDMPTIEPQLVHCLYKRFKNNQPLNYIETVRSWERLTPTGKTSFTAESVFAFITGVPHYEESHTAYEDVADEIQIYNYLETQKRIQESLY